MEMKAVLDRITARREALGMSEAALSARAGSRDLARLPQPGELALVTITEDDTASAATMVCRYLPPFLTGGSMTDETQPLRVDRPGVTVRYPIIGALRGLP